MFESDRLRRSNGRAWCIKYSKLKPCTQTKLRKNALGGYSKNLEKYAEMENFHDSGFYHVARIKQWLRYLNKEYPEADIVFERIKTSKTVEDLRERLCQD